MSVEAIWAREVDYYLKTVNAKIWDVRSEEEYRKQHICGAINVPYQKYEEHPESVIEQMEYKRCYVLYCDRGGTSMAFARELDKRGYTVKTVIGGINAYRSFSQTCEKSND